MYTVLYFDMLSMHAGPAPAISSLGIKPYQWGTECLSGDVNAGDATSFPMSIGMVWICYRLYHHEIKCIKYVYFRLHLLTTICCMLLQMPPVVK